MKFIIKTVAIASILFTSCSTNTEKKVDKILETPQTKEAIVEKPLLAQTNLTPEKPENKVFYVNASSGLSLRHGTNLRSKKLLTLPYGAQVKHLSSPKFTTMTIDGIRGDMIEVDYQGAKGFVFNGYLSRLAPPHEDEVIEGYAKRISTTDRPVKVHKVTNPKGPAFGLTTSIVLPAKDWTEAYGITKLLFDLPQSLKLDLTKKKAVVVQNKNKRSKTLVDEIAVKQNPQGSIQTIEYTYQLRDYSRTVTIAKAKGGFMVKEIETSK